jgi:hypothetical protein
MKKFIITLLLGAVCNFASTVYGISDSEANGILFMKQEEKLARDAYRTLYAKWGNVLFQNISLSEQRHMDAIDNLIKINALKDTTPALVGKFSFPELQALYDKLIASGNESLANALAVGVAIEEADIEDLQADLKTNLQSATLRVYNNLLSGSKNHLNAFTLALKNLNASTGSTTPPGVCDQTACPRAQNATCPQVPNAVCAPIRQLRCRR